MSLILNRDQLHKARERMLFDVSPDATLGDHLDRMAGNAVLKSQSRKTDIAAGVSGTDVSNLISGQFGSTHPFTYSAALLADHVVDVGLLGSFPEVPVSLVRNAVKDVDANVVVADAAAVVAGVEHGLAGFDILPGCDCPGGAMRGGRLPLVVQDAVPAVADASGPEPAPGRISAIGVPSKATPEICDPGCRRAPPGAEPLTSARSSTTSRCCRLTARLACDLRRQTLGFVATSDGAESPLTPCHGIGPRPEGCGADFTASFKRRNPRRSPLARRGILKAHRTLHRFGVTPRRFTVARGFCASIIPLILDWRR